MPKSILLTFLFLFLASTSSFSQCLSGVYTVGGTNPDYVRISDAVADLDSNGICATVVLNIRDGVYNEQFELHNITGVSSTKRIVLQSESRDSSRVTISSNSGSNNNYTIKIENDYVTLRDLRIEAANARYARVLDISYSDGLRIENCELKGQPATGTQYIFTMEVMRLTNGVNHDLELRNNKILQGSIGFMGNLTHGGNSLGHIIENNLFFEQEVRGLEIRSLSSFQVRGNKFISRDTLITGRTAILVTARSLNGFIEQNDIRNYTGTGIWGSDLENSVIRNNIISIKMHDSRYGSNGVGIMQGNIELLNNTIVILPSSASYGTPLWFDQSANRLTMKNNIIVNLDTLPLIRHAGIGYFHNGSSTNMDRNVYYTLDTTLFYEVRFSTIRDRISTLTEWQTRSGFDNLSQIHLPNFVHPSDLHILNDSALLGQGQPLSQVLNDFDGDVRGINNDIGADQYRPFSIDLALNQVNPLYTDCDSVELQINFSNAGVDTVNSVDFYWRINQGSLQLRSWVGSLAPQASIGNFFIDKFLVAENQNYEVEIWMDDPNGLFDQFPYNDTLQLNFFNPNKIDSLSYQKACVGDTVSLGFSKTYITYLWSNNTNAPTLLTDSAGMYSAQAIDYRGCIVNDSIQVSFYNRPAKPTISRNGFFLLSSSPFGNQWFRNNVLLTNDTFQLYSVSSNGYYQTRVRFTNGCEEKSDSLLVLVTDLDENSKQNSDYYIANPAEQKLQLLNQNGSIDSYRLFDLQGRLIDEGRLTQGLNWIDISNYKEGIYLLELRNNDQIIIEKVKLN